MTTSEQRLHPLSILFGLGHQVRSLLIPAVAVIFLSRSDSAYMKWQLLAVLVVAVVASLLRYLTFRIRYEENEMVVRSGVFVKNERHIPYARIQNIDATQGVLHRIFGVMRVHLQTAGGDEGAEAAFSVLHESALREMRTRVFGARTTEAETMTQPPVDERVLLRLTPRQLMVCGLIENRGMVLILALAGAVLELVPTDEYITRWIDEEVGGSGNTARVFRQVAAGRALPIEMVVFGLAAVLGAMLLVRLVSTVWAVIRLHNFTVTRVGEDLRMTHGLFTRVTGTIPLARVQSIDIHRGKLHSLFGMARVSVATAGGSGAAEAGLLPREPLAPIIRDADVPALLREVQPDLDVASVHWQPVHPRAFHRRLRIGALWWLAASALATLALHWWALPISLAHLAWTVLSARRFVQHSGYSLGDTLFLSRAGWLRRTIRVARVNRVQVVHLRETPFDRRTGMAQVGADTAGSHIRVRYLDKTIAGSLAHALAGQAARTRFRW